jgi:serine/threonine protein kinase
LGAHGDIKARNVVVSADGWAKVANFGCMTTADCERPIGCTPAFMAPEVVCREEQDPAADVWALGCSVSIWLVIDKPFYPIV